MGYYIKNGLTRGNEEKYRVAAKKAVRVTGKFPAGMDLNNQIRCLLRHILRKKLNIGTIKTNRSAQLNFRLYAPVFAAQIGVHKNY